MHKLDIMKLPDLVATQNGAAQVQLPTANNVAWIVEALGLTLRFNIMDSRPEFVGEDYDDAELCVIDTAQRLRIKAREVVRELIGAIAKKDPFHPMEDWLRSLPPASGDPIGDLIASVETDNDLWPVYVENWLVQVVEGVCGWRRTGPFSLPYVLVLVGGQGVGKTEWFKRLGGEWLKAEAELHLSSSSGKDHQLDVLRRPMAELAELDGIFRKSDISHMKAFISREEDAIRAPYERRPVVRPRMTTFCGSVNEAEFLNDTTGSRRFWPVQVESIDWGFQVDYAGVWAEAYRLWEENPRFGLTASEDAQRAGTAVAKHTLHSAEAEKIGEFYRCHHGHPRYPDVAMNRTEILEMLYGRGRSFSPKQVSDAGKILVSLIGKHRTIDGKQRAWLFPFNEFASDPATWPDKNHLESV